MSNFKKFTILLVEDEPADAHLFRLALKEAHVIADLHHVNDGVEALAFLRNEANYPTAPKPDLILLDLNMPRMNGRQFLQTIKQDAALHAIPVVILTTSDAENDLVTSYNHNAAGYIVKPVDMDEFVNKIRGLEQYWVHLVRLPAS